MQNISTFIPTNVQRRGGGRIASPAYRESLAQSEEFSGLEEGTSRYDLLRLVKRVGQLVGFSLRMVQLLEYYLAFTRDCDWEEGSNPIVYQSIAKTAIDLNCSERHIRRIETKLFEAGAITWNASGNFKRHGQRDPETKRILYAYGIDLTPLAYLKSVLENKLHEKQLYDKAWQETKREISWCRSQVRSLILELEEGGSNPVKLQDYENSYQEIAIRIRTHIDLQELRTLLTHHKKLHTRLLENVAITNTELNKPTHEPDLGEVRVSNSVEQNQVAVNMSAPAGTTVPHKEYINHSLKNTCSRSTSFQQNVGKSLEPIEISRAIGIEYITIKQLLLASSERFQERLPLGSRPVSWNDIVEAAYQLRTGYHISQQSWGEACCVLGRVGAAICVLITDQATGRVENPVRQPAAYFRGMVNRAREGKLKLNASIFALNDTILVKEASQY